MDCRTRRRSWLGLALAALASAAGAQVSEGPIRLIVPTAAGSVADLLARELGRGLGAELKLPVVVENKPGAGTLVGAAQVASAAPDGRTLLLSYVDHTYIPALYPKAPFDARSDFTGVAPIGNIPLVLLVHNGVPVRTAAELVAYAKVRPGKLTYASAGPGSTLHLTGELLKKDYGIDLLHVPYKGGAAARAALLAGEVDIYFGSPMTLNDTLVGQRVRALGMATPQRHPQFAELPTIAESTGKPFASSIWYGVLAPKATPAATLAQLNRAVNAIQADPEFRKKMAAQSFNITPMDLPQFNAFLQDEFKRWGQLIADRQISLD
ncbi:tripartite tricarboxylate transporter substrate-binding protein [Pseudorhodoferax sp.]|uniref:tripartite tricarboxylate transporter substrate-binding protein n=1 Tax=Pseudorhodoferax sp. TaxID=1993553 RepID=UPI002DD6971E|nr:tripartite tricarboxylate transporter substrate-binding protein [Pseudorhodoferax sp.]